MKYFFRLIIFLFLANQSLVFGQTTTQYDGVFELRAKELQNYVNTPNSKLSKVIKVNVQYTGPQYESGTNYVDYWQYDFIPIGCRRHSEIAWKDGYFLSIRVVDIPHPASTAKAVAAVIMRLLVQLHVNGDVLTCLYVPAQAQNDIVAALHHYNYVETGDIIIETNEPFYLTDLLKVVSDTTAFSKTINLIYQPITPIQ